MKALKESTDLSSSVIGRDLRGLVAPDPWDERISYICFIAQKEQHNEPQNGMKSGFVLLKGIDRIPLPSNDTTSRCPGHEVV
jgi:hypothetical protein